MSAPWFHPAATSGPDSASADYRRRARRLRQKHRHDPARLVRSLTTLAAKTDSQAKAELVPQPPQYAPSAEAELGRRFAAEVASRLDGGMLRYSARAALLKRAEKLGIGRFEANLLIAMVVHAAKKAIVTEPGPRRGWVWGVAVGVIVEGLIALGIWWIVRGL